MNKILLATTAVAALAASSALAADIPVYEPVPVQPVVAPVVPAWTGFYVGAQVGYGFRHDHSDDCVDGTAELFAGNPNSTVVTGTTSVECSDFDDLDLTGLGPAGTGFSAFDDNDGDDSIFGGLHIGADWQIGSFVLGGVIDYNWVGFGEDERSGSYDEDLYEYNGPLPGGSVAIVDGVQVIEDNGVSDAFEETPVDPRTDFSYETGAIDSFGTARLRAGFAAGRALFYATGGLAFGDAGDRGYEVTEYYTGRERDIAPAVDALPSNCTSAVVDGTRDNGAICTYSDSDDGGLELGWALGGGVDFLATDRISVGLEYLYVDLEDTDTMEFTSLSGDTVEFGGSDNNFHTVALRASWRFGK